MERASGWSVWQNLSLFEFSPSSPQRKSDSQSSLLSPEQTNSPVLTDANASLSRGTPPPPLRIDSIGSREILALSPIDDESLAAMHQVNSDTVDQVRRRLRELGVVDQPTTPSRTSTSSFLSPITDVPPNSVTSTTTQQTQKSTLELLGSMALRSAQLRVSVQSSLQIVSQLRQDRTIIMSQSSALGLSNDEMQALAAQNNAALLELKSAIDSMLLETAAAEPTQSFSLAS